MTKPLFALTLLAIGAQAFAAEPLSLKGAWRVSLQNDPAEHTVTLPGTLGDAKLGAPAQTSLYGSLTPRHSYIGKAVYTREITVSPALAKEPCELFLERVLWKSTLSIDGQTIGTRDSFSTPHVYPIHADLLTPGKHTLAIEIDNSLIHPIGEKGHAYGDSMQTRWNGIIGEITLRPAHPLRNARVFAPWPLTDQSFTVEVPETFAANDKTVSVDELRTKVTGETKSLRPGFKNISLRLSRPPEPWSEFNPALYTLRLTDKTRDFTHAIRFGFRTFRTAGNRWFVNDLPLFIRGNLDNCHFPLTGYPAMDKETWIRILTVQKADGLNALRFHSWCPPAAAFEAADELGIYLSPEAGIWIDGWMVNKGFPYLKGLGKGPESVDAFVRNELRRILDAYGNAPSFFSMSVGNELGSSDFNALGSWMKACRDYDPRHLYAASTARAVTPHDDFTATHNYPGAGMVRERHHDNPNWDYETQYAKTKVPAIAHEIGQWPVFPNWKEIDKYTGLLRAWNLEGLRDESIEAGTFRFSERFALSSLKTSRLMYKDEIESFMRTPSCAGIHLLGIQDYSGQGEALIGWLDSFYDRKPGAEALVPMKACFGPVAMLARFPKYTWRANETFTPTLQIHNYGPAPIKAGSTVPWQFGIRKGILTLAEDVPCGTVKTVGTLTFPLTSVAAPSQLEFSFGENRWPIWVYPETIESAIPGHIVFTDSYAELAAAVKQGRRVVFNAAQAGNPKTIVNASFKPVYWSTTWFPGQRNTTLGLLVNERHPALKGFPTEEWQNWQWYHIVNSGRTFRLNGLSAGYEPIVMPIVDFHRTCLAGAIFELRTENGARILVSGFDLNGNRPETQQLRRSLLDYASSTHFQPRETVDAAWLEATLAPPEAKATPRPKEFTAAPLYIEPAAFLTAKGKDTPWKKTLDRAELAKGAYALSGKGIRTWSDADGSYWVGEKITLTLRDLPQIRGQLWVRFRDPNKNGRSGAGAFEGRPFTLPLHQQEKDGAYWIKAAVDMEDALDNVMIFEVEKTTGPNLMIDRVVYLPNEAVQ